MLFTWLMFNTPFLLSSSVIAAISLNTRLFPALKEPSSLFNSLTNTFALLVKNFTPVPLPEVASRDKIKSLFFCLSVRTSAISSLHIAQLPSIKSLSSGEFRLNFFSHHTFHAVLLPLLSTSLMIVEYCTPSTYSEIQA